MAFTVNTAGFKLTVLVFLTSLALAPALGVDWVDPVDGDHLNGGEEIQFNVTNATDNEELVFEIEDNGEWDNFENETSDDEFRTVELSGSSYSDGETDLRVNDTGDDSDDGVETITVTLDATSPNIEFEAPSEFVSDEEPTVEVQVDKDDFDAEGDPADLENITINFSDSDLGSEVCDDISGEEASCSTEPEEELEHEEEYSVSATAFDEVGNEDEVTDFTFTVDTEYDGDDDPELVLPAEEDEGYVVFDDDVDLEVELNHSDSLSDTTVTCYVAGEDVDSFSVDPDEQDIEEECEIGHDSGEPYYDSDDVEIYVEMEDEAGNLEDSVTIQTGFDSEPPTIDLLDTSVGAESFNDDFDVEVEYSNTVSDIDELEYYFDFDVDEGDGNQIDPGTETFTVDTSDLESGSNTLYFRVGSEAGRWSSSETFSFEYYPDAVPELEISSYSDMQITSGESGDFTFNAENIGEVFIDSAEVDVSSPIYEEETELVNMDINDSVTESFEISTTEDDIGNYTLTTDPEFSEPVEVNLRVEANSEQREDIQDNFTTSLDRFEELEENVTELSDELNEERRERLMSEFTELNQSVREAESSVDNELYYEADSFLQDFDSEFEDVSSSYEDIRDEHRTARRNRIIMMVVGLISVSTVAGLGGLMVTGRFSLGGIRKRVEDNEIRQNVHNLYANLTGRLGNRTRAKDFEWEGFKEN